GNLRHRRVQPGLPPSSNSRRSSPGGGAVLSAGYWEKPSTATFQTMGSQRFPRKPCTMIPWPPLGNVLRSTIVAILPRRPFNRDVLHGVVFSLQHLPAGKAREDANTVLHHFLKRPNRLLPDHRSANVWLICLATSSAQRLVI